MGWLHKLHIPSFTLHTSYCLLLLPDFVYLRSNAMCHKQPWRPKPSIHSKHKIAAVATPACSLPHQSTSIQNSSFRRRGAAECPAHSVLDLVSVWTPAAGFAVHTVNCPEKGSDHHVTLAKSAKALVGVEWARELEFPCVTTCTSLSNLHVGSINPFTTCTNIWI